MSRAIFILRFRGVDWEGFTFTENVLRTVVLAAD
jgi:hypothetical protein